MGSCGLCASTPKKPTAEFELCISRRPSVLQEEQPSDDFIEKRLKAVVDRAIEQDAAIDIRAETLRDLADFYRSRQNFVKYEATLLDILHLRVSQRSDIVLSAIAPLYRLYSKHPPHYKTEFISIIDTLISDFALSEKSRWKLRKMKTRFFRWWGDFQSADVLDLDLINYIKEADVWEWRRQNYALAENFRSNNQHFEAEELYWIKFVHMREIQAAKEVIYETLHNFLTSFPYPPTNKIHKSRLLEASIFLQSQLAPFYQSMLCEYLSPSNSFISDSEVGDIQSFLCSVFHLLPHFQEPSYWNFCTILRCFEDRHGTKKETFVRLLLILTNLASKVSKMSVNQHLLAISRTKETIQDFQAAEVFLNHYLDAWSGSNSIYAVVYRQPVPSNFRVMVRKLYSR